jgi:hypothetical protein
LSARLVLSNACATKRDLLSWVEDARRHMPAYNVIADVSQTLQTALTNALTVFGAPPPIVEVHDLQGPIPTAPARLTLFLFEAGEDPSVKNRPRVQASAPPNIVSTKPPMGLLLKYLVTPWSGDRITDHKILGRTLQVFYDAPILSGTQLRSGLAETDQALKVTLAPLTLDERARVWYAVQKPYRLSLTYEVRVVNLDAEIITTTRQVSTRVLEAGGS